MRSHGRAFNQMSEQLEASDARRHAFLADVAHELRTPLTVVQGQLEAIEDGVYAADEERIGILLGHTRQMARLVEDLRTISLAEVGALQLELERTDLGALAHEAAAAFGSAASSRGVELVVKAADDVTALADAAALRRVPGNLITNAVRHTPTGGHVRVVVSAQDNGSGPAIEVINDGEGMSADLMPRAFERFEKDPGSDGSGLEPPIARDLVEAQGGPHRTPVGGRCWNESPHRTRAPRWGEWD